MRSPIFLLQIVATATAMRGVLRPRMMVATSPLPSLAADKPAPSRQGPTSLPLKIDGDWYDAGSYADDHPGGRWLMEYARGRDVTALFYSVHMNRERLARAALDRLPKLDAASLPLPPRPGLSPSELEQLASSPRQGDGRESAALLQGPYVFSYDAAPSDETPIPRVDSPLRRDLQAFMQRRFPTRASAKATPAMWARIALFGAGTIACWLGWLQGSLAYTLALPFVHWGLIAHTVHEATHGNLSNDPRVNFWLQFTSHPICFNVFVWIPQHLMSHHQYTNDYKFDCDCHHFAPALISDEHPRAPAAGRVNQAWTFVWKAFLVTLGTSILQPMRTLLEKPTPNYDVNITPVPQAVSKRTLLLSVLPSFLVMLYPLVMGALGAFAPLQAAVCTVYPWVAMSLIFTTMTQVSHVQRQTMPTHDARRGERCWTARQITTSLDYSMPANGHAPSALETSVSTAYCAGLNAQSLHHAMPSISCAHFPAIYEEYAAICERHDVPLRTSRHYGTAVREMLQYLFDNNRPAPVER